jgi:hypothetical protein
MGSGVALLGEVGLLHPSKRIPSALLYTAKVAACLQNVRRVWPFRSVSVIIFPMSSTAFGAHDANQMPAHLR